jgi:hypothetical protein
MSTSPAVTHCIETLCHKGCRQVRRDIEALERGQSLAETRDLGPAERAEVLAELRAIMAVYGDRCSL